MAFKFKHSFLLALIGSASFLYGCKAEAPAPKQSSTQDLLAQVEAIEADESALLFQQAKVATQKDNVKEARSLIQQALGRGAGSNGMAAAEAEIKKAESRITERKRKAEAARRAREVAATSSASGSYSGDDYGGSSGSEVNSITVSINVAGTGMSESKLRSFSLKVTTAHNS